MKNIKEASEKDLAAQIIIYRTLGINKDISILCMQELLLRKQSGNDFDYEKYIQEEIEKFPKIDNQVNILLESLFKKI